jgi:small subunit ribosomal protein S11
MGKKKISNKSKNTDTSAQKAGTLGKVPKKKLSTGVLYVQSTYNNTLINFTDKDGNSIMHLSSGALGFKGAKKGTPFAASKAAKILADKAEIMGVKEVDVVVKGVGPGRESAIRSFISKGIQIGTIRDITPVPHNGPRPKKPRRV